MLSPLIYLIIIAACDTGNENDDDGVVGNGNGFGDIEDCIAILQ